MYMYVHIFMYIYYKVCIQYEFWMLNLLTINATLIDASD